MIASCTAGVIYNSHSCIRSAGGAGGEYSSEFGPEISYLCSGGLIDVMCYVGAAHGSVIDITVLSADIHSYILFDIRITVILHPSVSFFSDPCTSAGNYLLREVIQAENRER